MSTRRRLEVPQSLQEEWLAVTNAFPKLVYVPRFLVSNARQIARMDDFATGEDLPGVVLSSLCENIRRSGTYQAAIYFGGRNLYPHRLAGQKELRIRHMVRWFAPLEILSILYIIYFNRYLGMRTPEDTWTQISPLLRKDVALGRRVGIAWESITPGRGMLMAGFRRIAQGFLLAGNKKNKTTVQKLMNLFLTEEYSSAEKEREICGYCHVTLAAYISQQCGFGVPMTTAFANAAEQESDSYIKVEGERAEERVWRDTLFLLSRLKSGMPSDELASEIGLLESETRANLDEHYQKILSDDKIFSWLSSEKEDMNLIVDHKIDY